MLAKIVVIRDAQAQERRIFGFQPADALQPVAELCVEPLAYVVLVEDILQVYLAYVHEPRSAAL